jgi:hypothetical protein
MLFSLFTASASAAYSREVNSASASAKKTLRPKKFKLKNLLKKIFSKNFQALALKNFKGCSASAKKTLRAAALALKKL